MDKKRYTCNLYGLEDIFDAISPLNAACLMVYKAFDASAIDVVTLQHPVYVDVWEHPLGDEEVDETSHRAFLISAKADIYITETKKVEVEQ